MCSSSARLCHILPEADVPTRSVETDDVSKDNDREHAIDLDLRTCTREEFGHLVEEVLGVLDGRPVEHGCTRIAINVGDPTWGGVIHRDRNVIHSLQ